MLSYFNYCILGYGAISSRLVDRLVTSQCRVLVVTDRIPLFENPYSESIMFVSREYFLKNHKKFTFGNVICSLRLDLLEDNEFLKLISAATINHPRNFLLLSSGSVYGETHLAASEETPTNPVSIYAKKRLVAETLTISVLPSPISVVILRISNVFGDSSLNDYVNITLERALSGREIPVFNGGTLLRDYIHIDDLIEAICLVSSTVKSSVGTLNISTGVSTSVGWFVSLIQRLGAGSGRQIQTIEKPVDVLQNSLLDSSKAKDFLNWNPRNPKIGLENYCRDLIASNSK